MLTRRSLSAGLGSAGLVAAAFPVRASELEWRGYRLDLSAAPRDQRAGILQVLHSQIDLIESIDMSADIMAWFRSVPVTINPALGQPGRFGRGRLELRGDVASPRNPVLLHELLHGYHFTRLPGGRRNPEVIAAWEAAGASGKWPARAYMLKNQGEFFAMTASVVLWGEAARPPGTRARVKALAPDWYDWLVREFSVRLA
jgi:hypothetical protein